VTACSGVTQPVRQQVRKDLSHAVHVDVDVDRSAAWRRQRDPRLGGEHLEAGDDAGGEREQSTRAGCRVRRPHRPG
jgi:hypothetical protein